MFPLVEGQTLLGDRYRFLSRLASGTFALILKAVDTTSDRVVAVKCTHEPALNAIGEREAALLRALNGRDPLAHVAVVRLLDCFTQRGHFCLVLELLGDAVAHVATRTRGGGGGGLQPWRLARPPPFLLNDRTGEPQHKLLALVYRRQSEAAVHSEEEDGEDDEEDDGDGDASSKAVIPLHEIRQMAVHLCAALAFLHDQGLIHADLKPENVVYADDTPPSSSSSFSDHHHPPRGVSATVKLVDFGNCIERRQLPLYEAADAADAYGGFDIQTLAYRAPEVAMGVAIAPAMDLWSLGCLLVECATGAPLLGESIAGEDGAVRHSLTNAAQLVEQVEWLLTGGEPLRRCRPRVYANARFYRYRAAAATVDADGGGGGGVADRLPLRHRLDVGRPASARPTEWREFADFVVQLLDVDPAARLTARAAFLHPFLQRVFPFQFVFAPAVATREIDTSPPSEQDEGDDELPRELTSKRRRSKDARDENGRRQATATKKTRHVSSSLRHALQLIPKPRPIKAEPKWG